VCAKPSGASPLKITAIVLGVLFGFLLLLGVLAAIAVPTFRTVRENTAVRGATLQAEAIAGAASEWAASRGEVTGPMHVEEAIRAMGGDVDSSDGDRYSVYVEEVRVTCTFAYVPGPAAVVEACTAER
jgi:type II secretory pathway pseudopilin PulG